MTRTIWLPKLGVSLLIYASLSFSSALQFTWGPEAVMRVGDYHTADLQSRDQHFRRLYPDFGTLSTQPGARELLRQSADWKFTSVWADAAYYIAQVSNLDDSIPPYRYRVVPTLLVRAIVGITGLRIEHAFVVFNLFVCLITAVLFEMFLVQQLNLNRITALLGGCLFVTSASNVGTLGFPMLEPASCLLSCLIFWSVASGSAAAFVLTSVVGVMTKEVLIVAALLWVAAAPRRSSWAHHMLIAITPVLAFVTTRVVLGGAPLEVNYGFDVLQGDFPRYGKRMLSLRPLLGIGLQVFLSFSFLWLGLVAAAKHPFLRRCLPIVPVTVIAAILLSSRLTRVLGILFPVVLSGCLLWLEAALSRQPRGSSNH